MSRLDGGERESSAYACGWVARLSPRVLAGTMVLAVLLVTDRFQDAPGLVGSTRMHLALWASAAVLALWALNKGAELRVKVAISDDRLSFRYGARPLELPLKEIETLRFDPPFAWRKSWIAATVLLDVRGRAWRLPVALEAGDRLVADLVRRSGRQDLQTWLDALRVEQRMRRGRVHTAAVYATAGAILIAALAFYLH